MQSGNMYSATQESDETHWYKSLLYPYRKPNYNCLHLSLLWRRCDCSIVIISISWRSAWSGCSTFCDSFWIDAFQPSQELVIQCRHNELCRKRRPLDFEQHWLSSPMKREWHKEFVIGNGLCRKLKQSLPTKKWWCIRITISTNTIYSHSCIHTLASFATKTSATSWLTFVGGGTAPASSLSLRSSRNSNSCSSSTLMHVSVLSNNGADAFKSALETTWTSPCWNVVAVTIYATKEKKSVNRKCQQDNTKNRQ